MPAEYDHLNLSVPPDVKHWFGLACQFRKRKMTAVLVEHMKAYASEVLRENHLPDPWGKHPAPPKIERANKGRRKA